MNREDDNAALIIVDLQNDFCPGGALAVPFGDRVIETINSLSYRLQTVVATQDWHPPNHISFSVRGGPWPPHCVQGSSGAELHPRLDRSQIDAIFRKASDPDHEAYSGFEGTDAQKRTLNKFLKSRQITTLYIAGLATDYCVRATAMDGLRNGYTVYVITDAVQPVDVSPGDGANALHEIQENGGRLITSRQLSRTRTAP